jgi:hypothetical protein
LTPDGPLSEVPKEAEEAEGRQEVQIGFGLTNATKGMILGVVSTVLALILAFGVELSSEQVAAIIAAVDAVLVLWIGLTYKESPKRIPDE